jgi:hypothetical protein
MPKPIVFSYVFAEWSHSAKPSMKHRVLNVFGSGCALKVGHALPPPCAGAPVAGLLPKVESVHYQRNATVAPSAWDKFLPWTLQINSWSMVRAEIAEMA